MVFRGGRNRVQQGIILILVLMSAVFCYADVTLPDVLSDGMVLQRDHRVPVWGTADPDEIISVSFSGQVKKTQADKEGRWRVYLDRMTANATPATLTITGHNVIEAKDVLVGEVWLCSGQSNMQLTLPQTNDGEAAIAAADHPPIRLFDVSREVAFKRKTGKLGSWQASSPESVRPFSAACYYFGVELQKELRVPIGLINSSYGGSQAEAWTPVDYLLASDDLRPCVERTKIWDAERPQVRAEYEEKMNQWREVAAKAKASGARVPGAPREPDALRAYRIAGSIYNGMIGPLIPFTIRGVLWYQGESNEERAQQYGILLPTMIRAWRERWGQGNFPFGIVQLPSYRDSHSEPADEPWSHLREAQRRTALNTHKAGLIVTIDIGEAHDIHPKNKLEVGKRMSRWALVDVYGKKMLKSGPMFVKANAKGSRMILTFGEVGQGLRVRGGYGEKLGEFAVAGADHQWHWAEARIKGRDRVEVWSDQVQQPEAVRYAFNNNPGNPNLTNDTGLPAAPFRSDDWPGPTDGKR
jgi:sialate O-acetylesterase